MIHSLENGPGSGETADRHGKTAQPQSNDLAHEGKMEAPRMTDQTKPMTITRTVKLDRANAQRALCRAIGAPWDADVVGVWEDVKVTWTEVLPTLPLTREQAS